MNNMKIIMEGWRSHVEDQEYEMLLEALLSSHGLLNESMADDIKEKVQKIDKGNNIILFMILYFGFYLNNI